MTAAQSPRRAPAPPRHPDRGWTPRGVVVVVLMIVLAAVLVLSHLGVSAVVLGVVVAAAVVAAVVTFAWLPREVGNGKEARDD